MKNYIFALGLVTAIISSPAAAGESLKEALKESDVYLKARYRFENVDSEAIAEDAHASTLRTVLGAKTGEYEGFSALAEFENITQLGGAYDDTLNGKTTRPTVVDVEDTAINQLYLQYSGFEDTRIRAGREQLALDDQRFIGHVGWRQNDQTFDTVNVLNESLPDTKIFYGYANNVNRIFGTDSAVGDMGGNVHMLNVSNNALEIGKITGYYYSLDFDQAFAANSSNTIGASLVGSTDIDSDFKFNYHVEYANQGDTGENANSYSADYMKFAPGVSYGNLTTTFVYEVLGADVAGDAGRVFSTPLATGHKFNGWADLFINTPAGGLEDKYIDVAYKLSDIEGDLDVLNGMTLNAQYHDFSADKGGADFGDEFGLYAKLPIDESYYVEAKYADFRADSSSALSDTQKITIGFGVNLNLTD